MKRMFEKYWWVVLAGLASGVGPVFAADRDVVDLSPIGTVVVGKAPAAAPKAQAKAAAPAAAAAGRSGKQVYESTCVACHGAGVAGAPKFGDRAAWAPRIAQGMKVLLQHATQGYKAMPPKGTCADCTLQELEAAIRYMTEHSGGQPGTAAGSAPQAAAAPASGSGQGDAAHGEKIVQGTCFACHGTGAAGAPKIGDRAAWAPRIAQGMEVLLQHATQGYKAMPPKGTCASCSEQDLRDAITYMVQKSR
ncbi:MAG: cytochrome c5 family protein [Gammaproteobacteria bacterium]|nr:MAG: cytochrome c5 family protein [Gammaproteobacteria bacterium]